MDVCEAKAIIDRSLPGFNELVQDSDLLAESLESFYGEWVQDNIAPEAPDAISDVQKASRIMFKRFLAGLFGSLESFTAKDGVVCYYGDTVYTQDGKSGEVVYIDGDCIDIKLADGRFLEQLRHYEVTFNKGSKPKKSLKAMRADYEAEQERKAKQAEERRYGELCKLVSNALTDEEFAESLEFRLVVCGYVGINASGINRYSEALLDNQNVCDAIKIWEDRDVRFRFVDKGILLYVQDTEPNEFNATWFEYVRV